jgi:hypothetical protein
MLAGSLLLLFADRGNSQRSGGRVVGSVFDSVSRSPLARAVVEIAPRDSGGGLFGAITDSVGRFHIDGLPRGRYIMGFRHDALNALGLDVPLRMFEMPAETTLVLDLAIPSGGVVRALRCGGDSSVGEYGMLGGFVRDLIEGTLLARATVTAEWRAIVVDSGRPHTTVERRTAAVADDGTYVLCRLPVDVPVEVSVISLGRRPIAGEVIVPASGARHQSFHLAESRLTKGPATLVGTVQDAVGKTMESGHAAIVALAIDVPIRRGAFLMKELPLGTWAVQLNAIGRAPRTMLVDLVDTGITRATIAIANIPQPLEPVAVVGKKTLETEILRDVLFRKRFGAGTVFLPGNNWLESAERISDVLNVAHGFRGTGDGDYVGREARCASSSSRFKVYVDGEPFPLGLANVDRLVPIHEVLAIEAYPDAGFAPALWRSGNPCAIVAVWTRRR